jgi:hypothetical protein
MGSGHPVTGDSATTMLNRAYARAMKRYRVTMERMTIGIAYNSATLPRWSARERLREWEALWLDNLRHERDQLLMGTHPRQSEFYRRGNGPASPSA